MANLSDIIREFITPEAENLVNTLKINLINNDSVDTGALYNSIRYQFDQQNNLSILMDAYGQNVEDGRLPGYWPKVSPLREWVIRRLGVPQDKANSVTYLVGRKIFNEGIKPRPFIAPAFEDFEQRITGKFNTQFANNRLLRQYILRRLVPKLNL